MHTYRVHLCLYIYARSLGKKKGKVNKWLRSAFVAFFRLIFPHVHLFCYLFSVNCIALFIFDVFIVFLFHLFQNHHFTLDTFQMRINRTFIHGVERSTQQKKALNIALFFCHFAGKITSNNGFYGGASKQSNITNQKKKKIKKNNKERTMQKIKYRSKSQTKITHKI